MSQSYRKQCRDCNQTIEMSDRNEGKWAAYELNGNGFHTCLQKQQQQPKQTLTLDQIDVRLKRVEKMLFSQGM